MRISMSGTAGLKKSLKDYVGQRTKMLRDEVNKTSLNVERGAKKKITADRHVDTGRLRSSIHAIPTGKTDSGYTYSDSEGKTFDGGTGESMKDLEAGVATNVEYAPKIEAIDSFMFSVWESERPEHIRRVKEILK